MVPIATDIRTPIQRQPDGQGFHVVCSGGFRGAEYDTDRWIIEPVLFEGKPCANGILTKAQFWAFIGQYEITPIAFQTIHWTNGNYSSGWSPIIPGQQNHLRGPSELWGSIASNFTQHRVGSKLENAHTQKFDEIATLLNETDVEERLAKAISLSLKSMTIHVEQIADYYTEQLVNILSTNNFANKSFGSPLDQNLYAQIHSFFAHFGAARDYLGALIAHRIGKNPNKIDSMSKLVNNIRKADCKTDTLLKHLLSVGYIQKKSHISEKLEISGWLKEATDIRNLFAHNRPYGQYIQELNGSVQEIDTTIGLYRYYRPFIQNSGKTIDVFDLIIEHYKQAMTLFRDTANFSGYNQNMITLTSKDILSIEISKIP